MNNFSFACARLTKGGPLHGGVRGRRRSRWGAFLALLLVQAALLSGLAAGQGASTPSEGVDNGNYNYQGSFELGYRFVDTNGSQPVYNTFVDEQQGPRLFEQTLSVRSLNHEGSVFDSLFLSSFGWGGDPENASRLRISKNKWYNFSMTFRRDRNFWDYNLLANPLNPPNQVIPVNSSPHAFETVRRMYDYNLTLLPQSMVRFRLGYTRNNMEGPSLSSIHEGTDTVTFQNSRTLLDAYQIGVDFKGLPRTNISYDQFLEYYKGDTSWADPLAFTFPLTGNGVVDPGIIYNPTAGQPCSAPIQGDGTYNPACNGFQAYTRVAPTRVSYPTEQLTLQSNYFRKVDLSARVSYSSSESKADNFGEIFEGLSTRSRLRDGLTTGQSNAHRVVANADLGVTVRVTDKFRVVDTFRFSNFRIPGNWTLLNTSLFGATLTTTPNVFDPATCPPPFDAATCPQHSLSSGPDMTSDLFNNFLKQDSKLNTIELEYDLTSRISGHLGYRFERRNILNRFDDFQLQTFFPTLATRGACATGQVDANGVCTVLVPDSENNPIEINGHSFLFGVAARPIDGLRASFDLELFSADKANTRISPRNLQHYKGRVSYKPKDWVNVAGTINILEDRNNEATVNHLEHNRNYGFTLMLNPKPRFGFEFGYNYDDVFSTTNICFVATPSPPGTSTCGDPFLQAPSIYNNKIHFGYTNIMFKPIPRVTANLGYNLTSTSGNTLILTPTLTTLGPLAFNFHKPTASVDVDLAKGFAWRTAWNYYDYNEKSASGPVAPRDFQSNSATLSLRYAF
ncbi:MAG: hypothetical protein LAN63_19305 [Acidobacteriia bacterium]|nr:hypothetical protein [Terriglobia bacterium]